MDDAQPLVQALANSQVRLEIRLPVDHPIAVAHDAAYKTANEMFKALLPAVDDNRPQAERDADDARNKLRYARNRDFRDACRGWFSAESPTP